MSLQNEQAEFADILFSENGHSDMLMPSHHMIIYRNNIISHLIHSLLDIYTMIAQLVGEDFFRVAAKEYIRLYPSRSGNLHDYGEYLGDFLAEFPPVKSMPYLVEVAKFEWACHQLHFAGDHAAMDIKLLETLSSEQYDELHFMLHPACRVIKFHYPILRIIALCKDEVEEQINLNEGGVNLMIIRRDLDIMLQPLTAAEFTFLNAIQHNQSLSEALHETLLIDAQFNLEACLPAWIQDKTIVDVY